jgi:hypothetical protein
VRGALLWMLAQALIAFCILISFGTPAVLIGIASLGFVAIYPFAKRFTWWPQVFLGLAFNWGALLGWVAHSGRLDWPAVLLYFAGIAWTLFYDTIYAHQDTEDDALIGVEIHSPPIWAKQPSMAARLCHFGQCFDGDRNLWRAPRRHTGADDNRPTGHPGLCGPSVLANAPARYQKCALASASVSEKSRRGPDPCAVFRRYHYAVIDPTAVPH